MDAARLRWISSSVRRRGLLISEGLGFFTGGIVDQHFSQFRGRLGRLSRALIYEHIRFGFGIDENTAMSVSSDGQIEVVGIGDVTIVDAAEARSADDSLGCHLSGLKVELLASPATDSIPSKASPSSVRKRKSSNKGRRTITEII